MTLGSVFDHDVSTKAQEIECASFSGLTRALILCLWKDEARGRFSAAEGDLVTNLNVWRAWLERGKDHRWCVCGSRTGVSEGWERDRGCDVYPICPRFVIGQAGD
jgi:hypothetical protein